MTNSDTKILQRRPTVQGELEGRQFYAGGDGSIVFIDELPILPDTDSVKDAAHNIAYRAEPFMNEVVADEFTMYSYDTIAAMVIAGITAGLLHRGLSEEEAIKVLQSKQVRWTLDGRGDELYEAGLRLSSSMDRCK